MATELNIVCVAVGQPSLLGTKPNGEKVYSSIAKEPVRQDEILLTWTNLAGDQQVQTTPKVDGRQVHGGNEKAVYVYPAEHYLAWNAECGSSLSQPDFGENLSITGITEDDVHIGDRWLWGGTLLEVSVPRQPCFKLGMHLGTEYIRAMWDFGRSGWYVRVVDGPGVVPTHGAITVVHRATDAPTVTEMFRVKERKNRA